jgi:hypothetical protein
MKAKATKEKVREEISKAISEHVGQSLKEVSEKTADRVVEIWLEFRRAHAKVVDFAARNDNFKRFLDTVRPADLPRLDEVVAIVLASEGEVGLTRRLDDGTLNRAVAAMPPGAMEIARESRSLEIAFKWAAVAGDALPKVVELELHRRSGPETFSKSGLQRLLSLQDRLAITRLAALQPGPREALFELEAGSLVRLARSLDENELASLSRYLTGLDKSSAQRMLSVVAASPARMAELSGARVREAIISSRDQAAALNMMLQVSALPDPSMILEHIRQAASGRVSPVLLWEKHGYTLAAATLILMMLLLLLKRLLFGARPRIIVQQAYNPRGRG